MRKFRVWYPSEKRFYYTSIEESAAHLGKDAWTEEYTIQDCVGLVDTNAEEIYEGDILQNQAGRNFIVEYVYHRYAFQEIFRNKDNKLELAIGWCNSIGDIELTKMIGNIFENLELYKNL